MKINLQTLHFKASDNLKNFVEEKVSKLGRFDSSIISAEVTLTEDGSALVNKTCDIRLVIPGHDNMVKKSASTYEEAVLDAVNTLQGILSAKK